MIELWCARAVSFFYVAALLSAQTIFFHDEGAGIVDRALIVPPDEFNRQNVERIAREFLNTQSTGRVILRLTIGTDKPTLAASLYSGPHGETAESMIANIRKVGQPKQPIARLLAVDNDATLSYRNQGVYSEIQLVGTRNPAMFHLQGRDYELLHFKLIKMGASLSPNPFDLHLFFKVSPTLSISSCVALTRRMLGLVKIPYLSVSFRRDVWFIQDQDYPLVFPFLEKIVLPDQAQVLAPWATCGTYRDGIRCSGVNFLP
jgi:hypothetical protein